MPPALSPAGRLRSRTSDISDLLRGRHGDSKTSTDSQLPPPTPTHIPEPVTPPKPKGKLSFLARMRKPSHASPASARVASEAARRNQESRDIPPVPKAGVDASPKHLPPGTGGSSAPHKGAPASLPPVNVSPPSLALPQLEGSSTKIAAPATTPSPHQRIPSGIPTSTLRNLRTQKSTSFEQNRRSNDSASQSRKQSSSSSSRPIITISPPHSVGGQDTFHAPRSAPRPPSQLSSRRRSQTGLPTSASTLGDRTAADSPTSEASSAASVSSTVHFPIPSVDGPTATTSYKEESLLRKDHFELGTSDPSASVRRGTVSGTSHSTPGSMGRSSVQDRQQRRHVSVMHLNKLKQDIGAAATPSRVRRSGTHSDSPSTSGQSGNESTSSQGTVSPLSRSKTVASAGAKKVPPPLTRTWHTPPTTGPPTEPLPSPPSSASLQPLILSSAARTAGPPEPSPPGSPQKSLPPLPPKDPPLRAPGAKSPDSLGSVPPSPARSEAETPQARTPVREDMAKKVLADENATAEQLRAALEMQSAKYARLMAYLLSLTERHGMEKHEFIRRIETLEADAHRRERELKGLRWLVANQSQSGKHVAPARADSSTLPLSQARSRQRSASESVVSSGGGGTRPGTRESSSGRMSIESPAGSTEEDLFELQTTIADFIAPLAGSPQTGSDRPPAADAKRGSLSPSARLRRSNTLPDGAPLGMLPPSSSAQKQARRTSSPVLPPPLTGSPARKVQTVGRAAGKAGLGIGLHVSAQTPEYSSSDSSARSDRERDPHARSDSSTLSSLPSLSTLHTSSSGLSSIPETPRTETEFPLPTDDSRQRKPSDESKASRVFRRQSASSLSSSTSSASGSYATSSRVSASPSIGQILDKSRQPEMDAILRKLRAFGHHGSP